MLSLIRSDNGSQQIVQYEMGCVSETVKSLFDVVPSEEHENTQALRWWVPLSEMNMHSYV